MPTIIHGGSRVPKDVRGLEEHSDGEVGGEGKAVVGPQLEMPINIGHDEITEKSQ